MDTKDLLCAIRTNCKIVKLIQMAIEIDEDDILNAIAKERDTDDAKFISHDIAIGEPQDIIVTSDMQSKMNKIAE